jgi:hypothetical protein
MNLMNKNVIPEIDEPLSLGVRSAGFSEMRIELLYKDILRALETE